jgi:hypothetical protein
MEDIKQIPPPVFRKGLPTKKWLKESLDIHFGYRSYQVSVHTYMRVYVALHWTYTDINEDVQKFCTLLNSFGISTENFVPYRNGTGRVGSVDVLPKIENKI